MYTSNTRLCWIYNISNNIQSQDGYSRITFCNLKKLEKTTLADISSLLKDFVGATVGFISVSFYLHRVSLNISTYICLALTVLHVQSFSIMTCNRIFWIFLTSASLQLLYDSKRKNVSLKLL